VASRESAGDLIRNWMIIKCSNAHRWVKRWWGRNIVGVLPVENLAINWRRK
jgi:hypothetical protein